MAHLASWNCSLAHFFHWVMWRVPILIVKSRVWILFNVHVYCCGVGFEALIDVVAHMFNLVINFFLTYCMCNRLLRIEMLRHRVIDIFCFDCEWNCGPMGMRLIMSMVGAIWKKHFKVEFFYPTFLCGGGCRWKFITI